MYYYTIMEQKECLKDQLLDFMCLYFHFYNHYIEVYIYIFLVKFRSFGIILKNPATVSTDFHFCTNYMISHLCLSHAHSVYVFLTGP
jgi:hypothetical protein